MGVCVYVCVCLSTLNIVCVCVFGAASVYFLLFLFCVSSGDFASSSSTLSGVCWCPTVCVHPNCVCLSVCVFTV